MLILPFFMWNWLYVFSANNKINQMSEGHNLLSLPLSQMYKIVGRIVDNGMN